jgi:hypothetical protein
MKTFLFGALAAVGLGLALVPQQASAHWETRTVEGVVTTTQRVWVPDPVVVTPPTVVYRPPVVVTPAPVVVAPAVVRVVPRPFCRPTIVRERVIIRR